MLYELISIYHVSWKNAQRSMEIQSEPRHFVAFRFWLTVTGVYLRVLHVVHDALMTGVSITKRYFLFPGSLRGTKLFYYLLWLMVTYARDIFYKNPNLFRNQSVVDRCIDNLAYTLAETRNSLNVVRLLAP